MWGSIFADGRYLPFHRFNFFRGRTLTPIMCYTSSLSPPLLPTGLLQLIDDIQSSIELGKKLIESTEVTNPVKVTYAIKQLAKETAVGE